MADYFIALGGVQQGPFPGNELPSRGMRADSLVWCDGMGEWQRADAVAELAALLPGRQQSVPPSQVFPQMPSQTGQAYIPPMAQYAGPPAYNPANSNRVAAGICAIFLGCLGVHKFILGSTVAGLIMLVVSVITCGFGAWFMGIIGIIEGIIYLSKSDPEFHQTYVVGKRSWF